MKDQGIRFHLIDGSPDPIRKKHSKKFVQSRVDHLIPERSFTAPPQVFQMRCRMLPRAPKSVVIHSVLRPTAMIFAPRDCYMQTHLDVIDIARPSRLLNFPTAIFTCEASGTLRLAFNIFASSSR